MPGSWQLTRLINSVDGAVELETVLVKYMMGVVQMAVQALALRRVGSLPRASQLRGASQLRKGGPSSCRLFCLRQTSAKLEYSCKLSCKNSSHDSTASYNHAVPCCLHNKHINVY